MVAVVVAVVVVLIDVVVVVVVVTLSGRHVHEAVSCKGEQKMWAWI